METQQFASRSPIDWDLSVNKDTKMGRVGRCREIQFRAEFFKCSQPHEPRGDACRPVVRGHGDVTDTVERPDFSGINTTSGYSRQIQFSMKAISEGILFVELSNGSS